jgi:uncharacterized alpha-E superfamily protein
VADGAGGMDKLAQAVIDLRGDLNEMRGEMRSFMDHKLAAEQRVEIRLETETTIEKAVEAATRVILATCAAQVAGVKDEMKTLTDTKIEKLEARLAAQEDRDKKRENDIRTQFIGLGVVGIAGLAYALFNLLTRGGG